MRSIFKDDKALDKATNILIGIFAVETLVLALFALWCSHNL